MSDDMASPSIPRRDVVKGAAATAAIAVLPAAINCIEQPAIGHGLSELDVIWSELAQNRKLSFGCLCEMRKFFLREHLERFQCAEVERGS